MPNKADIDWGKVQEERNAGATTTALAEKYQVTSSTICNHTKGNGTGKRARSSTKPATAPRAAGNGHGDYAAIIADLKQKRADIDNAIAVPERL